MDVLPLARRRPRPRRAPLHVLLVALLGGIVAACGGGDSTPPAAPSGGVGKVVADGPSPTSVQVGAASSDLGFRPGKDGFSFANYGNEDSPQNVSAAEMRNIFGDVVCANTQNGCELAPPAQAWMDSVNKEMAGGHCYGFSVTALLFFKKALDPSTYGSGSPSQLQVGGNGALQRRIAESMSLQFLPTSQQAILTGTPKEMLAKLADSLKPDSTTTYTIGITRRGGGGGHAVTPFALEARPDGHTAILIYDNNWPNTVREIDVDPNADTFHYQAAPNPSEPQSIYEGDATTKSLFLLPTPTGTQPCPFCGQAPQSARTGSTGALLAADITTAEQIMVYADGTEAAKVSVSSGAGEQTAQPSVYAAHDYLDGGGASYVVPGGQAYTITLDGGGMHGDATENVDLFGAGSDVTVDSITVRAGKKVTIDVSADRSTMTYHADDNDTTPEFGLGLDGAGKDGAIFLAPQNLQAGDSVTLELNPQSFAIDHGKLGHGIDYAVTVVTEDSSGEATFKDKTVHLGAGVRGVVDWSADTPEHPSSTLTMTFPGGSETLTNGG
jgi:hypothetical protein